MIPKIIHYCWFGKGKMPKLAKKCIDSWRKYCPEYEIKEWNESNFDINAYPYAKEAYENRKFAFVADVARLYALYKEGGIYMDTDVELIAPLDSLLHHTAFTGFELTKSLQTGLMGSKKGGTWIKDLLNLYSDRHFIMDDGSLDMSTNVMTITKYMVEKGLILDNTYQEIYDYLVIYPKDYFCPKSWKDRSLHLTERTIAIHHFDGSWQTWYAKKDLLLKNKYGIKFPLFHALHILMVIFGIQKLIDIMKSKAY